MGVVGAWLTMEFAAFGLLGADERLLAVLRSLVLPGLPLFEWQPQLGSALMLSALAAVGAWLRWGMDWLLVGVFLVGLWLAAAVMPLHHTPGAGGQPLVTASHEFTLVLLMFALLAQLRTFFARLLPGWLPQSLLPDAWTFDANDQARLAALGCLLGGSTGAATKRLADARLWRRARRINAWSRGRFEADPLHRAHAPLRAALALAGQSTSLQLQALRSESNRALAGVPDTEPTWVRPLDGMLVALALAQQGEASLTWRWVWQHRLALRHGRRPAALHSPTMLAIGAAPLWEQAVAALLAFEQGWCDDQDWWALRSACLAAAAGSASDVATQRLIAAGQVWARQSDDAEARQILGRRSEFSDPLAQWLAQRARRTSIDARD